MVKIGWRLSTVVSDTPGVKKKAENADSSPTGLRFFGLSAVQTVPILFPFGTGYPTHRLAAPHGHLPPAGAWRLRNDQPLEEPLARESSCAARDPACPSPAGGPRGPPHTEHVHPGDKSTRPHLR